REAPGAHAVGPLLAEQRLERVAQPAGEPLALVDRPVLRPRERPRPRRLLGPHEHVRPELRLLRLQLVRPRPRPPEQLERLLVLPPQLDRVPPLLAERLALVPVALPHQAHVEGLFGHVTPPACRCVPPRLTPALREKPYERRVAHVNAAQTLRE